MREVVKLDAAHSEAQRWFLNSWTRVPSSVAGCERTDDQQKVILNLFEGVVFSSALLHLLLLGRDQDPNPALYRFRGMKRY